MPETLAKTGGSATPRPATRRESTRQRRREILDAALACFLKQGVADTTMEQIRLAARSSIGSVYHLFASKEEIAFTLFMEGMRDYHEQVLAAAAGKSSAAECIRAIIAAHLKITVNEPALSLYLTRLGMADGVGEIAEEYRTANDSFSRDLFGCLEPFVERGEIVRLPQEAYFALIIGPVAHLSRSWLQGRIRLDLRSTTKMLADAAWRSLRPT